MRYVLKQKMLCLGDDYTICDADGNKCYYVDGRVFSIGDKLSFQDMDGNELAFIQQKLLSWGPTYYIYRDGEIAATLKKHLFTFFRCAFTLDVPGPNDYHAQGSFLDMDYTFERGGQTIASVSKKWIALTDSYTVDIDDDQDDILILASCVAIDLICHGDNKKHSD